MSCTSASTLQPQATVPILSVPGMTAAQNQALQIWGQNVIQQLQGAAGVTGVNVIPQQYALVAGSALPPIASSSNCTVTLDTGSALFGSGSYKVAITGSPATVTFSADTAWPLHPGWQWIVSFFQKASVAGLSGQISITTPTKAYTAAFSSTTAWDRLFDTLNLGADTSTSFGLSFTFTGATGDSVWLAGLQMEPYFNTPMGPSPFISTSSALTLDNQPDGTTYQRPLATALTSGQVDLSKSGVISKNTDNIAAGTGTGATTLAVIGKQRNLVPDSGFKSVTAYWTLRGSLSSGTLLLPSLNLDGFTNCWEYVGTGSPSGSAFHVSKIIAVTAGTYTLSAFVAGLNITAGNAFIGVYDTTVTTQYGALNVLSSSSGRISTQITIPAGVTQVVVIVDTNNCTVSNTHGLFVQQIQFEAGSVMSVYKETEGDVLSGSLLVDFANSGHPNKTVDNIGEGTNYARMPAPPAVSAQATTSLSQSGTTTTINVGAGSFYLGNITVNASSGSVDPGSYGKFFIYFDDPGYAGGAVTYHATTDARVVSQNPFRFYVGTITTASGGGGSGGGGGTGGGGCCLHESQEIELADGRTIPARELTTEMTLLSHEGPTPVVQLRFLPHREWYRVRLNNGVSLLVAGDHRFIDPEGNQLRAWDLKPKQMVRTSDGYAFVIALEVSWEDAIKVAIEVGEPHTYYVRGVLSHNKSLC